VISSWLCDNPLAVLALLLGVSVVVAGVLIGAHGLQWLNPSQPTVQLLSDGGVREQVIVLGASLFIPVFFIDLGLCWTCRCSSAPCWVRQQPP